MSEPFRELMDRLEGELCSQFIVRDLGSSTWEVETPFLLPDGQQLPVLLKFDGTEWSITDQGQLAFHLADTELRITEKRISMLERVAAQLGAEMDSQRDISMVLGAEPGAFEIADFIQVLAGVRGAALGSQSDRSPERYRKSIRPQVTSALQTADFEKDWAPSSIDKALYKADLRVRSASEKNLVIFMSGTTGAADRSALSLDRFFVSDSSLVPLLVYNPATVSSHAIKRFQDVADNDNVLVPAETGVASGLLRALKARSVAIH